MLENDRAAGNQYPLIANHTAQRSTDVLRIVCTIVHLPARKLLLYKHIVARKAVKKINVICMIIKLTPIVKRFSFL